MRRLPWQLRKCLICLGAQPATCGVELLQQLANGVFLLLQQVKSNEAGLEVQARAGALKLATNGNRDTVERCYAVGSTSSISDDRLLARSPASPHRQALLP